MLLRALDHEVVRRIARALKLRTNAGIAWLKRPVRQIGPITADGCSEKRRPCGIDIVVDPVHPFQIGTEAGPAGEIKGDMNAEGEGVRHGID